MNKKNIDYKNSSKYYSDVYGGFLDTSSDSAFPTRQLFIDTFGEIPSEYSGSYYNYSDIISFVNSNKQNILLTHYKGDGNIVDRCLIDVSKGDENVWIYIYDNGFGEKLTDKYCISILFIQKTELVNNHINKLNEFKIDDDKESKGFLNILACSDGEFYLVKIDIKCPEIDFDLNYNKDFKPIHETILERLSEDKSKGLVLLHGNAGTGKTNYIRYLINHLKKKVIYIPPNMSNSISDPNLIKFFIEHSNSVLVIEDAENVLMKRNSNSSQAISNILNLTDGLLSDCTNIQVIATFNTDVLNIDEALLRKGRLICKYEFSELESEITEKLAKKIGSDIRGKKTLAEIYNSKDESFTNKKEKIGFNK